LGLAPPSRAEHAPERRWGGRAGRRRAHRAMAELLVLAGDAIACCCCCTGCACWTACQLGKVALKVVRDIQVRPPCAHGLACDNREQRHLERFSHPDDNDYGYAIRVHGGKGQFSTIRQCFNFMDPYQLGYVKERAALRELLNHLGATVSSPSSRRICPGSCREQALREKEIRKLWQAIDTDGNGYISFPEFVEWASSAALADPNLHLPQPVGIVGEKGRAGLYALHCTVEGCACKAFTPAVEGERFCACCFHRRGQHAASRRDQILAVLPSGWASRVDSFETEDLAGQRQLVRCGPDVEAQLQQVIDASIRRVWTRDRGKENKVPVGYRVVRVERNENVRLWLKYAVKKTLMVEALTDQASSGKLPPVTPFEMLTSECARTLPFLEGQRPDAGLNEWYLWHGASSAVIKSISQQEFKQLHAGTNTGALYGAGTYLSDSCTKGDEYAREIVDGEDAGLCCLLLCRVMGGRVRYTDERSPDGQVLVREVLEGPYDCVLGDREKCRGTFKEIVVYESSQAYPEYLVYYRRLFEEA